MAYAVKNWQQYVFEEQEEMFGFFGEVDWDMYCEDELHALERKVTLLLLGRSTEDNKLKEENQLKEKLKEEEEMKNTIDNICKVIVDEGTHTLVMNDSKTKRATYMVFIFVYWKDDKGNIGCEPVFRVPNDMTGLTFSFIDVHCRVYSSWQDFLKNNQFPACEYGYPRGGKYYELEGCVVIDFGMSPAAKKTKKALNVLDIASTSVAAAGTTVIIGSLMFPVAAPLMVATQVAMSGVSGYSIFRSSTTLHDRRTHKQSIGFLNRESRGCYISILASTVGFGAAAATSATVRMAQAGRVMGTIAKTAVTALNGSSLVMNGVGVINSLEHLIEKHREKQLSAFEVAQFSASLLLFCHSTVNFKTAQSIIENTQNRVLDDFKNGLRSNRHRKVFNKAYKGTVRNHGNTDGNAMVIRSIRYIDNVDDFFASLVRTDKDFRYVKCKVAFADGGHILVNDKVRLDPRQLAAVPKSARVIVLRATQKYNMNKMSEATLNNTMKNVFKDAPTTSAASYAPRNQVFNNNDTTCTETQGSDWKMYVKILLSVSQTKEVQNILKHFPIPYQEIIVQLSDYIFKTQIYTQGSEYVLITDFVSKYVQHILLLLIDGQKEYILGVLKNKISHVPLEDMNNREYCLLILEQLLLKPIIISDIFTRVKTFFDVLQRNFELPQNVQKVNFLELVSAASILMRMERPLWRRVIECAEEIFYALGLQDFSLLTKIVKNLCLYIQQVVVDMEKRHRSRENEYDDDDYQKHRDYCVLAVESLNDAEVSRSLVDKICENHLQFSSDKSYNNTLKFSEEFTQKSPLVLENSFWAEGQKELLSENQINIICKKVLKTDNIDTNYVIQCEGLDYFIVVDDKLVTVECDIEADLIRAFVDTTALSASLLTQTDCGLVENKPTEVLKESNLFEYTKEHPLILEKHFQSTGEKEILTEEEILDVCIQTLQLDHVPQECMIEFCDLKIFINVEGKVVVVDCDIVADRLHAYVDPSVVFSMPCDNSNPTVQKDSQYFYTKNDPLVIDKCFENVSQSELLSEEEILNISNIVLCDVRIPQDASFEYYGSSVFVYLDNEMIVINCDINQDRIFAYMQSVATSS